MRLLASGAKIHSEESSTAWWLIEGTESEVVDFMELNHIEAWSSGPGQYYSRKPVVKRSSGKPERALITMYESADI